MKRTLSITLALCLLISCAVLCFRLPGDSVAYAASENSDIVGSWIGTGEHGDRIVMLQFKEDGTLLSYYDGNYTEFRYSFNSAEDLVTIGDTEYFCSVCGNGMVIQEGEQTYYAYYRT